MKCPKIAIWNTVKYGGETTPEAVNIRQCCIMNGCRLVTFNTLDSWYIILNSLAFDYIAG